MALFFDWKVDRVLMVVGLSSPLPKSSLVGLGIYEHPQTPTLALPSREHPLKPAYLCSLALGLINRRIAKWTQSLSKSSFILFYSWCVAPQLVVLGGHMSALSRLGFSPFSPRPRSHRRKFTAIKPCSSLYRYRSRFLLQFHTRI